MWTRGELKSRAKSVLSGTYWQAFLVSIVLGFAIGGGGGGGGSGFSNMSRNSGNYNGSEFAQGFDLAITGILLSIVVVITLLVLAFRVFLGYALEVGCRRYYIRAAQIDSNINYIGYAFNKQRYSDILKTMLLKGVYNVLWFFVFIIPSIVKYYSYKMTPYILADNPNIGPKRAIELSMQMTNGHKFRMFVLKLSFLGWYLLGIFACCIGGIFVAPYEHSTEAELYLVLRQNALENGFCTHDELLIDNTPGEFDDFKKPLI